MFHASIGPPDGPAPRNDNVSAIGVLDRPNGDTIGIAFAAGSTVYRRTKVTIWRLTVRKEPVEGLFVVDSERFVQLGDAHEFK